MRRILVTGGLGFIGSNLIRMWLEENPEDEIINLDCLTYAGSIKNLEGVQQRYTLFPGDITNARHVKEALQRFEPDGVIHCAAESHVDNSISGPQKFYQTNVIGTFTLINECHKFWNEKQKKGRFLHMSTDEVYGSLGPDDEPFDEESPYRPRSPYSASKAGSDHVVDSMHHTFGMDTIVTHCSNNYGPRQFGEKLLPKVILNSAIGKPIPIYGNGENIRDWIFVEDHCWGVMQAFEMGNTGNHYCFGGNCEMDNNTVARLTCLKIDRIIAENPEKYMALSRDFASDSLIQHVEDRKGHDQRYAIHYGKALAEFGWTPEVPFDIGIEQTARWYLDELVAGRYKELLPKQGENT